MKKLNFINIVFLLFLFFNLGYAQHSSELFYATMETPDAIDLQRDHPDDIIIINSSNGFSAVKLSEFAAHELHHKVLVHGPGFIYESSEKSALAAIERSKSAEKSAANFTITQEALVGQSLDLVDNLNIARQIQKLEDYGTRYHTTSTARQAVLDLKTKWENLAGGRSDVSVRIVNHTSTDMPSVVMTIQGAEEPDDFVIIGGHIDSTSRNGDNDAPGADDNASGIATITEAARILFALDYKPKKTVEFMAFAAEEVGLRGSKEIAEDYKNHNVNVVSYMQLDMTDYKGSEFDVAVSTDSYNDENLNSFLRQLMDTYNASGTHKITYGTSICNYGCSDHYSWAQQGYNVAFPFEARFEDSNPNIHTNQDTFDKSPTPNATHAAKFAKLALEYLIEISKSTSDTGGGEENCSNPIASFPYNESFEGSVGNWIQSNDDDLNWTVNSNGTPSTGTGPESAVNGSSYIYVEASGDGNGFPNKTAILISPCFDVDPLSQTILSFSYHMQGSSIGNLSVDVSADAGDSWNTIFDESAAQGDAWNEVSIDITTFVNSAVKIRLRTVTGNSWQGDVAIDALSISDGGSSNDICAGVAAYDAGVSYQAEDKVNYQGNLYERTASGWNLLGACNSENKNVNTQLLIDDSKVLDFYPNPIEGNFVNLTVHNQLWEGNSISIFDAKGSLLKEMKLNQEVTKINTSGFSTGIYFINLKKGGKEYSKQFVKK